MGEDKRFPKDILPSKFGVAISATISSCRGKESVTCEPFYLGDTSFLNNGELLFDQFVSVFITYVVAMELGILDILTVVCCECVITPSEGS